MLVKKYFSISEVAKITNLPLHKLRYIEKIDDQVIINKIRGRRYYSKKTIEYINKRYSDKIEIKSGSKNWDDLEIISKIDSLIAKFLQIIN